MKHPAPVFLPTLLSNLNSAAIRFALFLFILLLVACLGGRILPLSQYTTAPVLSVGWFQDILPVTLLNSLLFASVTARPTHNALAPLALTAFLGCLFVFFQRWSSFHNLGEPFTAVEVLTHLAVLVILPAVLLASWWRLEVAARTPGQASPGTHTGA